MSDLIEKLKEIDLGNGRLSCGDTLYLRDYVVHNVPRYIADTVRIIFLVESPHTDEVKRENRYPLAGHSGRNVTEDLMSRGQIQPYIDIDRDRDISIGKLVRDNRIPWLAIMNVSLLPLQKIAYGRVEAHSDEVQTLWCAFKEIKRELEQSEEGDLCPTSKKVYEAIIHEFACRIEQVATQCQPNLIIPFGNVARRSLCKAKQARPQSLQALPISHFKVWHPSKWRDKNCRARSNPGYKLRDRHLEGVASEINTCLHGNHG